jgi:type II secretion system protein N
MLRLKIPFELKRGSATQLVKRGAAFMLFGLCVFVVALQAMFPYDRVKDRLIDAVADSHDLQIGSVERGWIPGRVYFNNITLRKRATKTDEVVAPLFIRRLKVDTSLLALIWGSASIELDAELGDAKNGVGHVTGSITLPRFGQAGIDVDFEGNALPGAALPLRTFVGLPILGKLNFAFKLELPRAAGKAGSGPFDWRKASGLVQLSCPSHCTIGDGRTKLKPLLQDRTNQVMVADGIDFGKLELDSLVLQGAFVAAVGDPDSRSASGKPGRFELKKFELKSPDGELRVDYSMTMAQDFGESMVSGCLRYKANERLLQKEETKRTYAAISTIGAELRADGLFHIRLTDRFKEMKRLNQECGSSVASSGTSDDTRGRGPTGVRPGLTSTPPVTRTVEPDPAAPPAMPMVPGVPQVPTMSPSSPPQPPTPTQPPPGVAGYGSTQPPVGQGPASMPSGVQGSGAMPSGVAVPGPEGMPGAGGMPGGGVGQGPSAGHAPAAPGQSEQPVAPEQQGSASGQGGVDPAAGAAHDSPAIR